MQGVATRSFPGRGHSVCKGPEAGVSLKGRSERERERERCEEMKSEKWSGARHVRLCRLGRSCVMSARVMGAMEGLGQR